MRNVHGSREKAAERTLEIAQELKKRAEQVQKENPDSAFGTCMNVAMNTQLEDIMTDREYKELDRIAQQEAERQKKNQKGDFKMSIKKEPKGLTRDMLSKLFGNNLEKL